MQGVPAAKRIFLINFVSFVWSLQKAALPLIELRNQDLNAS